LFGQASKERKKKKKRKETRTHTHTHTHIKKQQQGNKIKNKTATKLPLREATCRFVAKTAIIAKTLHDQLHVCLEAS
jgi:hypothetical protein